MQRRNSLKVTQGAAGIAKIRTKGSGSRSTSVFHPWKSGLGTLSYRPELFTLPAHLQGVVAAKFR